LKSEPSLEEKLGKLLSSQKLGVLATQQKKNPYTSLVAFACSDDMRRIVFATPKTTRKFANIISNSNVSFFIDNRSNKAVDFRKAIGVTALGSARQFLSSPSCAFICIDVKSLYVVERFQNVLEMHLE
jgi:hypothetical protein